MNFPQIIVLLQLVLALLSNPQSANNPQVQLLVKQAVSLAIQQSTVPIVPQATGGGIGVVVEPPKQETVVGIPTSPVLSPSCSLTGTLGDVVMWPGGGQNGVITFTWKLTNMSGTSIGKLYSWNPSAPNNPEKPWYLSSSPLTVQTWGAITSGATPSAWKAVFPGNVTCYAFFHDSYVAGNAQYFFNGATTSPNPIETYQQGLNQ